MRFERPLRRFVAPAFALSLGLTACGDSPSTEETAKNIETTGEGLSSPVYTGDGRKITVLPTNRYSDEKIFITSYCESQDLVTVSEQRIFRGAAGGVDRSVDHPACADGILTESDFSLPR